MNERFKEGKWKDGFTLIELTVVMAVIAVLVLLAVPRFLGKTKEADKTKHVANAKVLEDAAERYYIDEQDWPRLTDDAYTSEEIESYSERVLGVTGEEVTLDPEGNYYDIDYDKLSDYVQVPDNKKNYILQNPVGKVFYMDNLNEAGIARVNYSSAKKEDDNPGGLRKPIEGEIAIATAEEIAKIGTDYPLDGKYILTSDIDLSGTNWTPIGRYTSNTNKSPFTGSFDGNGYNITGLTINRSGTDYVGLFGYTEGATIENVALEENKITGRNNVGGLVGYAYSGTKISNSYSTGSVTGSGNQVGGLVGDAHHGNISNSYATGSVKGKDLVGGLVGDAYRGNISNSYATGSVTGSVKVYSDVGGLVGYAWNSTISNSYATGKVTGSGRVGGFVGEARGDNYGSTTIRNSYWDTNTTGQRSSSGQSSSFGKSTDDMKKQSTYSGWDFETIWRIDEGNDYPKLR